MARERRAAFAAALLLALIVVLEFLPALSLGFAGDDFELLSLARIGGFAPRALVLSHRGAFVKPVLNAAWAACAALFGANAGVWYTLALLVHILNATLLGLLARRLVATWSGSREPASEKSSSLAGLLTALVWAVHDRLSEPVFSIASLNHSLTFVFYLAAMLAAVSAIATRTNRARLLTALFVLLALFSYEVGASVLPALGLLVAFTPDVAGGPRGRLGALGIPAAGAVLVWGAVQGISRLAPGAVSYYALSPSLWLRNFAEIGLAFLHIPSYRIEPSALLAAPFAAVLLGVALWPRMDRIVRFGCAWALAASLPVLPIPFFSDRYHYIVFAGIAIALGRGAAILIARSAPGDGATASATRRPRVLLAAVALLVLAHTAWSILGAREQARFYAFKNPLFASLLEGARSCDAGVAAHPPDVLAILWRGAPGAFADWIQETEPRLLKPRFSEEHSIYVRPHGILGAVYPADLFNVAAADRGGFYRRPAPSRAARGIAEGDLRVVVVGERIALAPEAQARLAGRLRDALVTRREIPQTLSSETPPSSLGAWNVAWLEPADRNGAFEDEYDPAALAPESPAAAPAPEAPPAAPAPASR